MRSAGPPRANQPPPERLPGDKVRRDDAGEHDGKCERPVRIESRVGERRQARALCVPVVAAGLHGARKRFGMAECAREQRDYQGRERAQPSLANTSCELGAAADLRTVHRLRLEHELGQKPQGDSHHHAELVSGHTKPLEPLEQRLEPLGDVSTRNDQFYRLNKKIKNI